MMTSLSSYPKLQDHFQTIKDKTLRDFFNEDPDRAAKFSIEFESIFLDYSKNRITQDLLQLLLQLVEEAGLKQKTEDMFTGKKINTSENRAVLHTALRNVSGQGVNFEGINVMEEIEDVLERMREFSEKVRS